jgi:hypothetical protein
MKYLHVSLGSSWSWSHGSWIYNYLCNQYLSPLKLQVRISLGMGVLDTTCDTICQLLATGWCSSSTLVSYTNKSDRHDITEILLKVALNTITLHVGDGWNILYVSFISNSLFCYKLDKAYYAAFEIHKLASLPHLCICFCQYIQHVEEPSWLWSYGSWIYNYLSNQYLSPLKLKFGFPIMARCIRYNVVKFVSD